MKVLVTGCTGFIGRHLMKALMADQRVEHLCGVSSRNSGGGVSSRNSGGGLLRNEFYMDCLSETQVRTTMEAFTPNVIFHLAGNPNTKLRDIDPHGFGLWHTNVRGTHNMLAYAPKGCRFVLASSAAVYGDAARDVGRCDEERAASPTSVYGASKLAAEGLVQAMDTQGRVRGLVLRYIANVGVGARHGLLPDLVHKVLAGGVVNLHGNAPGSIKPFMHVSDTALATVRFGLDPAVVGPINVGPEDCLSVTDAALAVMSVAGVDAGLYFAGDAASWAGDNRVVMVNNRRMRLNGFVPRYPTSLTAVKAAAEELIACARVAS